MKVLPSSGLHAARWTAIPVHSQPAEKEWA